MELAFRIIALVLAGTFFGYHVGIVIAKFL